MPDLNPNPETETMMKRLSCLLLATALLPAPGLAAPVYTGREHLVRFVSHTPVFEFRAESTVMTSVWDAKSSTLIFSMPIRSFHFANALMEEHFNENYLESEKFPKSNFRGTLKGMTVDQAAKPGTYAVTLEGTLEIHGVSRPLKAAAKATVDAAGVLTTACDFKVALADHGIQIPGAVGDKIAEIMDVHVEAKLQVK